MRSFKAGWWMSLLCCVPMWAAAGNKAPQKTPDPWLRPAVAPAPDNNRLNPDRVHLGKVLFFDPRLSSSGFLSCASCHNPAMGWADGLGTGIGHDFKKLSRATPTILNTAFQPLLMWDGRKNSLEQQALGPIEAPGEMNMPLDELIRRLNGIKGYKVLFERAYPGEPISTDTVGKALASFERTILSTPAPFDAWRKGDQRAMSESAKRGFALFNDKANCVKCHQGFNFTDNGFHNIGVKSLTDVEDEGRFAHRKIKVLRGAFKTPTLRDVELTAPYMHNGLYNTLEDVIDHYDRGGDVTTNLSPNMKPLNLSASEKSDLVAFMKSLTGAPMRIEVPQLPLQ